MNVSMMDSYNLSWKLVHSLHGLSPRSSKDSQDPVLATYEQERLNVAQQLIEFDSRFSSMFSGQIGAADPEASNLTHEMFLKVFSDGSGFTSGCGIEYPSSILVFDDHPGSFDNPVEGTDYLQGTLKAGRRLLNTRVRRYADSNPRNLQDGKSPRLLVVSQRSNLIVTSFADFPSTGRYRILVLASSDLLQPQGVSATSLHEICGEIIPQFPNNMIELVAVHPIRNKKFEWTDIPACLKEHAEMRFHGVGEDDVYATYGVAEHEGAIVVVRPDGYVGAIVHLSNTAQVLKYLKGCLVQLTA